MVEDESDSMDAVVRKKQAARIKVSTLRESGLPRQDCASEGVRRISEQSLGVYRPLQGCKMPPPFLLITC